MAFRRHDLRCAPGVDNLADFEHWTETPLSTRPHQAVALRRRWLRHPLVAGADPVELARRGLRPGARLRAAPGPRARRRHRYRRHRRDQHPRECPEADRAASASMAISAWSAWSACSRTSIPARSISRGRSARRAFRSRWAASTCPAAWPCSTARPSISSLRATWASPCLPAKPKAGSTPLLRDAAAGQLKPLYNYHERPAGHRRHADPLPAAASSSSAPPAPSTSFDAGRGCPFQCSFCTIINVQGRKSRFRTPDDIEQIVRENWAQGITRFFITDDNFARNKEWEAIFDRLSKLREVDKIPLGLMIQVDTMCHKIPTNSSRRRSGPASRACSSGWRTSTPTIWPRPRKSRTRSPNTAR